MSSIFTPPGTSQRNNQINQQTGYATSVYNGLWPGLSNYLGQQQSFATSQLPNQERMAQNAYFDTTQGGRNAEVGAYGAQQMGQAQQAGAQAAAAMPGNRGLQMGARLAATNAANLNTGTYAQQVNSPQGEAAANQGFGAALASMAPNYGSLGAMNSTIYGQPQVPVGQGFGQVLGSLIPTVTGNSGFNNWLGGVFGGSGAGSGSGYNAGYSEPNYMDPGGANYMGPSSVGNAILQAFTPVAGG